MTTGTGSRWRIEEIDRAVVDRLAAAHLPDSLAVELGVDLVADPHRQDDDGNVWTLLRSASSVSDGRPAQWWSSAPMPAGGSAGSSPGTSRSMPTTQS